MNAGMQKCRNAGTCSDQQSLKNTGLDEVTADDNQKEWIDPCIPH
jgi:hypothetical protein